MKIISAERKRFHPVNTSVDGVYVCGAFQGPKDIPQSVVESSAAACASGMMLSDARGTEVRIKNPARRNRRDGH